MKVKNDNKNVTVIFNKDEAIVLLEWLSTFTEKANASLFEDQSEQRVLFDLEASLEKVISETFESNYSEVLLKARQKLRD